MQILVVEDEERIASFIARGLRAEGFAVRTAFDGDQALNEVAARDVDLVILDLLLPGADGLDVLRRIRELQPAARVLILSARRDVATKLSGLRGGACDYLTKPFSFDELVERIRIHLRADGTAHGVEILRTRTLALDIRRREANVGNGPIALTAREFRLLEHLVRHVGEVVCRERLLSTIWGYDFDPRTNVVDVCVRRLRRKLGDDRIETVRSAGYRLVA